MSSLYYYACLFYGYISAADQMRSLPYNNERMHIYYGTIVAF